MRPLGTEEHERPSSASLGSAGRPALVVAYPTAAALEPPPSGVTVGRDWLANAGLSDGRASAAHLKFSRGGGVLAVEDVGSRNGTWVDGERIAPNDRRPLADGAVLRLGRTVLVFREDLRGGLGPSPPLGGLVGPYGLRAAAEAVAGLAHRPPRNVLVEGETGTGKELATRLVATSLGRAKPFAVVNVAGVPAGVFESQVFGHVRGAFSGAGTGSRGIVRAHEGGAVVLDEIGELPLELQPKILRLLENREILPVGADHPVHVDVLLIAATHRRLDEMVRAGAFRQDLFARLASARLALPALRDRIEDVPAIARALFEDRDPLEPTTTEVEAVERLLLEVWPENVRGLAACLDAIARFDPSPGLRLAAVERVLGGAASSRQGQLTERAVAEALQSSGGNETSAAQSLGVSRGKLRRFLAQRRAT